jgi:hypothetical protein
MQNVNNLQKLTNTALEQLQRAFQECRHAPAEGMILSALVTVRQVHDALLDAKEARSDLEYEELCCAV